LIKDVFTAIPAGLPVENLPSDANALAIGTRTNPEAPTHCGSELDQAFFSKLLPE
jgi:hypothetical protein